MNRFRGNINYFKDKEQSIVGILSPILWDRNGKIKDFSIYSDNEEDIVIEGFSNKRRLQKLANKRVIAKGLLRSDENGENYIKLRSIKELTNPTSPVESPVGQSLWLEEYSLNVPEEYTPLLENNLSTMTTY